MLSRSTGAFAFLRRVLLYDLFALERRIMRIGIAFGSLLCVALAALPARGFCQFSPAPIGAASIPSGSLIQPPDLVRLLQSEKQAPLIFQVGSRMFFAEAHIRGSQYAGPGSQEAGLQLLENTVAKLPKNRSIVLYCGCCPWNHCPNVGPAYQRLRTLGFTRVQVLYMPSNFGDDWVSKGYPTDRSQ